MLHDCSGLGERSNGSPSRWARELVRQGYVVAIPDSFSTRGHANGVCVDPSPSRNEVSPLRRVPDAYEALAYVRALPYVDGERVGVMGGSHGGSTTLATVGKFAFDPRRLVEQKQHGFVAAVALYPGCVSRNQRWAAGYQPLVPLLILIGERDDWTPAPPCVELVEAANRAGAHASIKVYPGAHHAFDGASPVRYLATRVNANAPGGRGATTGGNAEAWADSIREVSAFFARHLLGR
jgi:dienelactone hydrolase